MLQFAFLQIVIYYILLKRFIFKVTLCSILLITLINFEHGVAVRKKFTHSQKAEKKFLLAKNFPPTPHHFSNSLSLSCQIQMVERADLGVGPK